MEENKILKKDVETSFEKRMKAYAQKFNLDGEEEKQEDEKNEDA